MFETLQNGNFVLAFFLLFNEKRTNKICYHLSPFYLLGLFMHCFSSVCPVRQNLAQFFFTKHVNFLLQDHSRILGTSNQVRSHQCFLFTKYIFFNHLFLSNCIFPLQHHSLITCTNNQVCLHYCFYKMYFFPNHSFL